MVELLDFTGRVAVITGGGQSVGRGYADLLASRGASVVVNDLGTSTSGGGADVSRAEIAASEIRAAGGTAIADASDISTEQGARDLIQRAHDEFGRVDIVLNNAGIFALDEFPAIDVNSLQRMLDVHVRGAFLVTRAAWPHFTEQSYGRVVFTTSASALGAADTVAYGTAKMGVLGLARAIAFAGAPIGVRANLVAPQAMSRMVLAGMGQTGEVPDIPERAPRLVAPLVAALAHESCDVNGEAFTSGTRRVARFVIAETEGYVHPNIDLTPEDVLEHWQSINDFASAHEVGGVFEWSDRHEALVAAVPLAAPVGNFS